MSPILIQPVNPAAVLITPKCACSVPSGAPSSTRPIATTTSASCTPSGSGRSGTKLQVSLLLMIYTFIYLRRLHSRIMSDLIYDETDMDELLPLL